MSRVLRQEGGPDVGRLTVEEETVSTRKDDTGNTMIVAVGVLMVVGIVATSVWVKTLGGLDQAAFEQKRFAAFSVANTGFDVALFRLEQWDFDLMPPVGSVVFTGTGSTADGDYGYTVVRTATRRWTITATGRNATDQSVRSIKADVYTVSRYTHGIYSRDTMTLNGNPDQLCEFTSSPTGGSDLDCPPDDNSLLGSSGTIQCQGAGWDEISMTVYPPSGGADTACLDEDGSNVIQADSPYEFQPITAPPSDARVLPGCTVLSCTMTPGMFATLAPGNYAVRDLVVGSGSDQDLCRAPLPVGQSVKIYVTGTLTFADGVYINVRAQGGGPREGCNTFPPVGPWIDTSDSGRYAPTAPPSDFIVIRTCSGQPDAEIVRQGNSQPVASMVLDAMCSRMTSNGGPHFLLFGAALLDQFRINGSLRLLAYDTNLANLREFQGYRVTKWREVPPQPELLPAIPAP